MVNGYAHTYWQLSVGSVSRSVWPLDFASAWRTTTRRSARASHTMSAAASAASRWATTRSSDSCSSYSRTAATPRSRSRATTCRRTRSQRGTRWVPLRVSGNGLGYDCATDRGYPGHVPPITTNKHRPPCAHSPYSQRSLYPLPRKWSSFNTFNRTNVSNPSLKVSFWISLLFIQCVQRWVQITKELLKIIL